ncbi:MAG: hypothetical protein LBV70_00300, partial [Candidatus Adiutrix sp.]|nr:hypothetical protein [Candidatus Adiutrix sp.]
MSGKNTWRRPLIVLLAAFLAAGLLQPAGLKAQDDEGGLSGSLGAGMASRPEFEGSDRYTTKALPVVNLKYGPA